MGTDHQFQPKIERYLLILLLLPFETLFCLYRLLIIPSGSKNIFLFGMTKERLLMVGVFAILFLCGLLIFILRKRIVSILHDGKICSLLLAGTLIFLFLCLMPDYRFGKMRAYALRFQPFILCLMLNFGTLWLTSCYQTGKISKVSDRFTELAPVSKPFIVFLSLAVLLLLMITLIHWGIATENSLWNKNGIPLESIQLFLCLTAFFVFKAVCRRKNPALNKRIVNFFVIWAAAAVIWRLCPMKAHFFAPGPYDPNYEYYVYSDAISYEWSAYSALNGWGFDFGRLILKPLVTYVSFLCHLICGSDYNKALLLQSAVYAILPAIIYLFGTYIRGDLCGFLAAALCICKEWNALNSQTVLTINSRLIMSEFLTQILFASYCCFMYRRMKFDGKESLWAAAAGCVTALGLYTRYNIVALIPAGFIAMIIAAKGSFRKIRKSSAVFVIALLITASPMLIRSYRLTGKIYPEMTNTFSSVLVKKRYNLNYQEPNSSESPKNDNLLGDSQIAPEIAEISESVEIEKESFNRNDSGASNNINIDKHSGVQIRIKIHPIIDSILNHGIHNFISSFMTFPMQLRFDDSQHLFNPESGLWADDMDYHLTPGQWIMVVLWSLVICLDLAYLWHRDGFAGISFFYFWFVYAFSIGVSRSSGGRYVVPVNWIPMLLIAVFADIISSKPDFNIATETVQEKTGLRTICVIGAFTCVFLSMCIFEKVMPRTVLKEEQDAVDFVLEQPALEGADRDLITQQIEAGIMNIRTGKAIFPRFYYYLTGEHASSGIYAQKDYSRLTFIGLYLNDEEQRMNREFMLPHTELINDFPNDTEFYALACNSESGYEDALTIVYQGENGEYKTVIRDPLQEFKCPVSEPVCMGIENCR